jgi:hypothetical protein
MAFTQGGESNINGQWLEELIRNEARTRSIPIQRILHAIQRLTEAATPRERHATAPGERSHRLEPAPGASR